LTLPRLLDLAAQLMKVEIAPAEARFWSEMFRNESPEMLEWAFREYLRTAKFFPKPADITLLIADRKTAIRAMRQEYRPIDREALLREQESPEWQAASAEARALLARIAGR
jgi:hypothetical protein